MAKKKVVFYIADLDKNGIYLGVKKVSVVGENDIEVPENCDLEKGKYKRDGDTFVPVRDAVIMEVNSPVAEEALCRLILSNGNAPAQCKEWAKTYFKSFDGKGLLFPDEELSKWGKVFIAKLRGTK